MKTWLMEPRDAVIFGDGRGLAGNVGHTHVLPPPTTVAGIFRTRHGSDQHGRFTATPDDVRAVAVHGPIGAILDDHDNVVDWWFPRPADALELEGDGRRSLHRLAPMVAPGDCTTSAVSGLAGPTSHDLRKPARDARPFWRWSTELRDWLVDPRPRELAAPSGFDGPIAEERVHVAISVDTGTAMDGALFSRRGTRWTTLDGERWLQLAIAVRAAGAIRLGVAQAGGERRFVRWRDVGQAWPEPPPSVLDSAGAGYLRVVLATPAALSAGSAVGAGLQALFPGASVRAQISGRPLHVSGWDLALGRPKPTRRLVPAGSVFFIKLAADASTADRRASAQRAWLQPISDLPQDRLDGLGLALLGAWDGHLHPITSLG